VGTERKALLPVVDFLKIPEDDEPYLEGHKCRNCATLFLGQRRVCSRCYQRDTMEKIRLSNRGTLYSYSIVHRSYPGIDVPYISAVVDLEDGVSIKGNLINVAPDPAVLSFDMPVEVVYKEALGRKDREGNSYLSYFFEPRTS